MLYRGGDNNDNVLTQFTTQAGDARDQSNHVASDLFGNAHSQGVLTLIVRTDTRAMKRRQIAAGKKYPYQGDAYCLHVHEFDIIIGPKGEGTGGRDFVWGFSSINGLPFGSHETVASLEQSLWFVGISRSNHYTVPDLAKGIKIDKQGFSAITSGICSIRRRWSVDIYPGDTLVWRLPSLREAKESMARKTTTRHSQDKLMAVVEPLDWSYLRYAWRNVCQLILRSGNDMGISHRLGGGDEYGRINSEEAANIRAAKALKEHTLTVISEGVAVLAMRGLVEIQTPYKKKKKMAMVKLLKAALEFGKSRVKPIGGGGGLNAASLTTAVDGMNIEGKKLTGLSLGSLETKAPIGGNMRQANFIKAYLEYSDAVHEKPTDVSTSTNIEFKDEFEQPYTFFAQNKDLSKLYSSGLFTVTDPSSNTEAKTIDTNRKMDKINDALFVSNYLGLVNGGKGERERVTYDLLNATHVAFGQAETSIKYLTGYPLGPELDIIASQKQLNMLNEYQQRVEEHLVRLNEEMSKLSQSILDRKVGTAVSHAASGNLDTVLDVLVKA